VCASRPGWQHNRHQCRRRRRNLGKRLAMLLEAVPTATHVGFLCSEPFWDGAQRAMRRTTTTYLIAWQAKSNSQGRKAGRYPHLSTDEIHTRDQPENRKGAWPRYTFGLARPRRRGDRIRLATSASWHFSDLRPCPRCVRNASHSGLSHRAKLMSRGLL
jgi:hypothetical protein